MHHLNNLNFPPYSLNYFKIIIIINVSDWVIILKHFLNTLNYFNLFLINYVIYQFIIIAN